MSPQTLNGTISRQQLDPAIERLLQILRCPSSGSELVPSEDGLSSIDGEHRYRMLEGIPDLRRPPARLRIDVPWYEPWDELKSLEFDPPSPLRSDDLPFHLDAFQAAVAGDRGNGRWLLEIGCAARHSEPYFSRRGFNYVGTDYDKRGIGPHVLADAHNLPFADESFDLVYAMAVLEHLVCPLTAMSEALRVLKPGGTVFGSAAFVYGFHDVASFHHMSHGGLLCVLRAVGFEDVRIWPGWMYTRALPAWAFRDGIGAPWRWAATAALTVCEKSFVSVSNIARRLAHKPRLNVRERCTQAAGGLNFAARKPLAP